ncbi:MAG: hypothetical protein AAGF10_07265 [Verrucomicrobiota bacterium]
MSIFDDIHQNLESLIVKKDNIRTAIANLDTIFVQHKDELPGDLAHYLERRSYEKAWLWVNDGKHIPRGTCGGKE